MTIQEKDAAAKAIEDTAARLLALEIVEAEYRIEGINKRLKGIRYRITEEATQPNSSMYADNLESWLRDWRNEYTQLCQETHALKLLNHLAKEGTK